MKKEFQSIAATVGIFSMLLVACTPGENLPDDREVKTSSDHSFVENEFDAISKTFEVEAALNPTLNKTSGTPTVFCPDAVTDLVDNGDGTYTMTINYGTGCNCADGRTREGLLTGVFSGKWNQAGTKIEINPTEYAVTALTGKKYEVEFTKRITYNGLSSQTGNKTYSILVNNASFTSSDGLIEWNCSKEIECTAGCGDIDPSNNEYSIQLTANGTASNDLDFTVSTIQNMVVRTDCPHIVSGIVEIAPSNLSKRVINYGNGECDDKADLTIGNFSTTIVLR